MVYFFRCRIERTVREHLMTLRSRFITRWNRHATRKLHSLLPRYTTQLHTVWTAFTYLYTVELKVQSQILITPHIKLFSELNSGTLFSNPLEWVYMPRIANNALLGGGVMVSIEQHQYRTFGLWAFISYHIAQLREWKNSWDIKTHIDNYAISNAQWKNYELSNSYPKHSIEPVQCNYIFRYCFFWFQGILN